MNKRRLQRISLLFGMVLFAYLLHRVGWNTLLVDLRTMGWFLALIVLLSGIKYAIRAFAWATAFYPGERQPVRRLFRYFLAGEALNYLSVAGPFLGEPAKASMLRGVRFAPGLASTLLETAVNGIAAIAVTVVGMGLLVLFYLPGNVLRYAGWLAILLLVVVECGFVIALKCRVPILTWPWRRIRRFFRRAPQEFGENLAVIEERMHQLSSERPGALWLIFLLGFVTQALALLEIYAAVLPLGIRPEISSVLVMEAFTKLVKTLFFFVPGRIGTDEGSTAGIFGLLGLAPSAGVMLALARRLRAIFWSAVGLVVLLAYNVTSTARRSDVNAL